MNVADVMDDIAARVDQLAGLTSFGYPPDNVAPPASIASFPESIDFDATGADGADSMVLPLVLLFGRVSDRASRDNLSRWLDRAGTKRYRIEQTSQLTKQTFSVDGSHLSTSAITQPSGPPGFLQFTLSAGTSQGISNLRDVYLCSELVASDFHARTTFDPPFYGDPDAGGPLNAITPQMALCLRYQRDTKQRAVMVWSNIVLQFPALLVGVWQANLDGTGFANRQYPIFFPEVGKGNDVGGLPGLSLPYTVEVRLRGNVVRVRHWKPGVTPVPSFDDPNKARTLNLDTDCGDAVAIPTPVGSGQAGVGAAHLGIDTSPLSAARYRLADTYLEADSISLKRFIETGAYSAFDSCRVMKAEFDVVARGGVDHLAVALSLDIIGNGKE